MKSFSLFLLTGLSSILISSAQTVQKFDIFLFGDKVGTMTVSRKDYGNGTHYYELKSHSEAKVMFVKKVLDVEMNSTYENGKMVRCYSRYVVNDKTETFVSASWDGSKYNVENEKGKSTHATQVLYSVLHLFYKEPSAQQSLWSERVGQQLPIKHKGSGVYEFKNPGGATNVYKYENGKVKEVEMQATFGTSYMRPAV